MDHHKPTTQRHIQLVQQLADSHWSVHQAFVLQTNAIALINAITRQMSETGDPIATAAAIAPATRQLNTYSIYEGRRRRAAKAILEELTAFEQELAENAATAKLAPFVRPRPIPTNRRPSQPGNATSTPCFFVANPKCPPPKPPPSAVKPT